MKSTGMEKSATSRAMYENLNAKIEKWTTALNTVMIKVTPIVSHTACVLAILWIHQTSGLQRADYLLTFYLWSVHKLDHMFHSFSREKQYDFAHFNLNYLR